MAGVLAAAALAACGVVVSPREVIPTLFVESPVITPEAEAAFGRDLVLTGHREVTGFALANGFRPEFLDPQRTDYSLEEFMSDIEPHLSAAAASGLKAIGTAALAGDADAQDALRVFYFYRWNEPTWSAQSGEDIIKSQRITDVVIGASKPTDGTATRLVMTLTHTATLRYVDQGVPFEADVRKKMTYWAIPSAEYPDWVIDGYDGSFSVQTFPR